MKQYETDISNLFKGGLQQHSETISFESVWSRYESESSKPYSIKKVSGIPIIALITLIAVFTVSFAAYEVTRVVDKIDYPFVDDQWVIGRWDSVDFVSEIEQFTPDKKAYNDELYLTSLVFINGGDTLTSFENGKLRNGAFIWTKELILDRQDKTASKYEIKEIDGETYLFFEWKSGDYMFRGMKPEYYVLKKTDSERYTHVVEEPIADKVDYPFVNDPEMLGSWQSVDYVEAIEGFKPGAKSWLGDLRLTGLDIEENGEILTSYKTFKGKCEWTKGLILDKQDKTASKYEIKEIDGDTYLFFEWKSGDYLYGRAKPKYYVLKKLE